MKKALQENYPVCRWPSGWEGNTRHLVVDNIIVNEARTHILLVRRAANEIEEGKWALPGGYVDPNETVVGAAIKETEEEASVPAEAIGSIALFRIVDNPDRRGEAAQNISAVFVSVIPDHIVQNHVLNQTPDPDGGTEEARWWHRLDGLPEMAFDHREIIAEFTANPQTYPLDLFISTARPS